MVLTMCFPSYQGTSKFHTKILKQVKILQKNVIILQKYPKKESKILKHTTTSAFRMAKPIRYLKQDLISYVNYNPTYRLLFV